jgi:predicted Rossmann fold flavoprotein
MTARDWDVVVVGAGAAGLMASIFAAREGARVVALDGATKLGAKILVAGGGRCNVTHHVVSPDDFNATNRNLLARVLRSFDVDATIRFFREIGVALKREETGKLFPLTDKARTVLEALLREVHRAGGVIRSGSRVTGVESRAGVFRVTTPTDVIEAGSLVLATGGRSLPKTGSDGAGYQLAAGLGHSVTPTFPALVPLLTEDGHWGRRLGGVSVDVELSLSRPNGSVVRRLTGPMLFAHFGLTGPAVLDMSRYWIAARQDGDVVLSVSFLPGETFESLDRWILQEASSRPRLTIGNLLRARLTDRLADEILSAAAGVDPSVMLGRLEKEKRRAVIHAILATPLPISGDRGFAFAEVTAGGVPLEEIDSRTMESRVRDRLYLCGEILDVDGRIGGFNFQWAWASGRLAGISAALGAERVASGD